MSKFQSSHHTASRRSSLFDLETPADWSADALCAQVDPELFFPGKGSSPKRAKKICAQCPVIAECLAFALSHFVEGVWGGTTYRERMALERNYISRHRIDAAKCGTESGHRAHYRRGESPCDPCREAASAAKASRKRKAPAA